MKEFSFTKSRIGIGIGFAATIAVISALSVQAADLSSAKLMEVVKDVRILPSGGNPISATVGASISGKTAVTTGRRSRAELEFNDRTLMRIGSSTTFSIAGGRDVNLEKGALLLQTPDGQGNGVRIRAGGVTAAITGSMGLVSLSEPTDRKRKDSELFFKFISIHGDMHLELDGQVFDLKPFQMLFLRLDPTGKIIAEPIINTIDGSKLIKTSDLVQEFKDNSRLMQPPINNRLANQFGEKKSNRWNVVTTDSSNRMSPASPRSTPPPWRLPKTKSLNSSHETTRANPRNWPCPVDRLSVPRGADAGTRAVGRRPDHHTCRSRAGALPDRGGPGRGQDRHLNGKAAGRSRASALPDRGGPGRGQDRDLNGKAAGRSRAGALPDRGGQ
ncbi:FecR domain-containing protein [Verrucomicrobiales bacterium]|nr:FecR domain-containing protein [Verrucomicrobiales bacterium]